MIDLTGFKKKLDGRKIAVFGLGVSGLASVAALLKAGIAVAAWDDTENKRDLAQDMGAEIVDLNTADISGYAFLLLSPGISFNHAVVERAKEAGLEILGDLEILHRLEHGRKTIGITGTNGKSTTTALIGHILQHCGMDAKIGGNIGKAALSMEMPGKKGILVLEVSSYQMDLCPTFTPDIAVLLNITPDHIDRHGSLDAYAQSKRRILGGAGHAVIGVDDDICAKIAKECENRTIIPVSVKKPVSGGAYMADGQVMDDMDGTGVDRGSLRSITALTGAHNHQNALCAYVVARLCGCDAEQIMEALRAFPGLSHRQQVIRVMNGVPYINDSKATNADAAAKALASFRNIYWICGGRPKEGGLDGLESYMDNIAHAFTIGEAMEDFSQWLDKRGVAVTRCETLDVAVAQAHEQAQSARSQPGGAGVVLLSPACASWDQFSSFEERGEFFARLVRTLPEDEA